VALQLKRAGVGKVRPIAGGFEAWHKLGLPTEPLTSEDGLEAVLARSGGSVE
jgi:3-mercaptopyruvate sulfurtransferase SseA